MRLALVRLTLPIGEEDETRQRGQAENLRDTLAEDIAKNDFLE